jgi:HSP20 family protein
MPATWTDLERTFTAMDELRRKVERAFDPAPDAGVPPTSDGWPRITAYDDGKALVLVADVPGIGEQQITVSLDKGVLTLKGKRAVDTPAGATVHRQERRAVSFSRSFTLPFKVDGEGLGAQLKDGVLTVTLPKSPEAQPRQIVVKAG